MIREIYRDCLFLGNAQDARDVRLLAHNRIAAVVDLAINELPAQLARDMVCCRYPLHDGDGNPPVIIQMAVRCVVTLMENGIRTLVACSAGMSRSPAIAAVALAIFTRTSPDDCLTAITSHAPHDVSPTLWSGVKIVYNQIASRGD